jgi:hypothetical protein
VMTRELRKESFPMCAMTNHYKPGALKGYRQLVCRRAADNLMTVPQPALPAADNHCPYGHCQLAESETARRQV